MFAYAIRYFIMNTIFKNKLLTLRKEKGWTQEQMADFLNISQSAYSRIERGESIGRSGILLKICEVFDVSIKDFVSDFKIIEHNTEKNRKIEIIIGEELRFLRIKKRWTQKQVADFLGISSSCYSRIELGKCRSWIHQMEGIIRFLSLSDK